MHPIVRYTVRDELWEALRRQERPLRWLARRVDCTGEFLGQVRSGRIRSVSKETAVKIAHALARPLDDFFVPIATTNVDKPPTQARDRMSA